MISTVIELKDPLVYISRSTDNIEYKTLFLTDREWGFLYNLREIFEVFNKPSIRLQSETYTTLNRGLLYVYTIFDKLEILRNKFRTNGIITPSSVNITISIYLYLYILTIL